MMPGLPLPRLIMIIVGAWGATAVLLAAIWAAPRCARRALRALRGSDLMGIADAVSEPETWTAHQVAECGCEWVILPGHNPIWYACATHEVVPL